MAGIPVAPAGVTVTAVAPDHTAAPVPSGETTTGETTTGETTTGEVPSREGPTPEVPPREMAAGDAGGWTC